MSKEIYIKVSAIVVKNQKILLIKERVSEDNNFLWNTIKGSFDQENETVEECTKREIFEESGLKASSLKLAKIYTFNNGDKFKIQFNFVAKVTGTESLPISRGINIDGENISELRWFSENEIKSMRKTDFVADYTQKVLTDWIDGKETVDISIITAILPG
jgi:ADP-ribose pyrophosphatase YjhB (NUDIX family)